MQEAQDADALELFLAERGTQLMRTAVLLAGGRQDGEDLMQAALERLIRQGRRIIGSPEGYLRRTLYNLAADRWRRQETWRRKLPVIGAGHRTSEADLTAVAASSAWSTGRHRSGHVRSANCWRAGPPSPAGSGWTVSTRSG